MIDKLELRVPRPTPFRKEFWEAWADARNTLFNLHESQHYLSVVDMRPYGYEAILHSFCRHGEGNHKLELVDTGRQNLGEMTDTVVKIFDHPKPGSLDVMRVDCAADITGVPVSWFQDRVRAQYKRFACEIGKLEYAQMGSRSVETLYIGKRPNCFRIYDKVSEYRHQYDRVKRACSEDQEIPSFEETFGMPESGLVLTRVERQMGAGRVPSKLAVLGSLKRAPEFNPFDRLKLLQGGRPEPDPHHYQFNVYCTGMYLRDRIQRDGMQQTRAWVNQLTQGKADRTLRTYRDFLPEVLEEHCEIDERYIYESYRLSALRQVAA